MWAILENMNSRAPQTKTPHARRLQALWTWVFMQPNLNQEFWTLENSSPEMRELPIVGQWASVKVGGTLKSRLCWKLGTSLCHLHVFSMFYWISVGFMNPVGVGLLDVVGMALVLLHPLHFSFLHWTFLWFPLKRNRDSKTPSAEYIM